MDLMKHLSYFLAFLYLTIIRVRVYLPFFDFFVFPLTAPLRSAKRPG